jgi:PhnB protein
MFDGQCEEALNFYASAFGGTVKDLNYFEGSPVEKMAKGKKRVLHAHLIAKDFLLMASDSGEGGPAQVKAGMVHLSINFHDVDEEEKVYRALSEGGLPTMPLQDTFWGARFGMLTDKFGVNWMFNCDKKQ